MDTIPFTYPQPDLTTEEIKKQKRIDAMLNHARRNRLRGVYLKRTDLVNHALNLKGYSDIWSVPDTQLKKEAAEALSKCNEADIYRNNNP